MRYRSNAFGGSRNKTGAPVTPAQTRCTVLAGRPRSPPSSAPTCIHTSPSHGPPSATPRCGRVVLRFMRAIFPFAIAVSHELVTAPRRTSSVKGVTRISLSLRHFMSSDQFASNTRSQGSQIRHDTGSALLWRRAGAYSRCAWPLGGAFRLSKRMFVRKLVLALLSCAGLAGCDLGYEGALADCRANAVKQAPCQATDQQCVAQRSQLVATCMGGKNFFLGDNNEVAAATAAKKTGRGHGHHGGFHAVAAQRLLDYINNKRTAGR
jgi:hypothetical protein